MSTRITIPAGTSLFVLAGLAAVLESDAYVAFDADRQAIADAMIQAERQDLLPLLTTYIEPNKEFPQGAQKVFNSVGQEVIQSREDFERALRGP